MPRPKANTKKEKVDPKEIKKEVDLICENNGGDGVLREVADLILSFHTN